MPGHGLTLLLTFITMPASRDSLPRGIDAKMRSVRNTVFQVMSSAIEGRYLLVRVEHGVPTTEGRMGVSVCLLNLKGGVGKTSTCYHAAGVLAREGRRMLVVDADPQASLTQGFFGPAATRNFPAGATIAALYDLDHGAVPESLVRNTAFHGLDIVAGSRHLTRVNMTPPEEWGFLGSALREALDELSGAYDVILIDCPPNLHLCSWSAMTAASHVVVPLQPEDFGSQGLAPVQEAVAAVQAGPNPGLTLAGYLLTMVDKTHSPRDV